MRIAWFSPLPPVTTGVAACSAELVAVLRARGYVIETYPETRAHDFPWIHRRHPYDLVVYQFGNSSHHDYEWPYALRYPGLTVLHDTRLHHARAALLLREKRRDDYRRELIWSEPGLHPDAAEIAVAGFDSRLYYDWPMVRGLVVSSRLVAVHGEATKRELVEALAMPNAQGKDTDGVTEGPNIVAIRLGHGELVSADRERDARARIRARYGIAPDAVLFGVFGGLTPEKRLPQIVAAFRAVLPYAPTARLLLGGAAADHYPDMPGGATADRVVVTGYIADHELTDHIASVDVSLHLRWPSARETSGPWLRALAAGKPTVVTDLLHRTDVPILDPRTWLVTPEVRGPRPETRTSDDELRTPDVERRISDLARPEAVTIAIDIVDEDHSLRLAMRRLATDADLRRRLGDAGRDYWRREHTVEAMADDYERVVHGVHGAHGVREVREVREVRGVRGVRGVQGVQGVPPHVRPDGDERLRQLLAPFGIESPF